ncbi:b2d7493a-2635-4622-a26f-d68b6d805ed6 [Thermothielavioides terrestris]|uniref:HECT-type E3 ubiquitin transferase n=1 Tax=Thermothielavioides terrestris TaxID=2587410 RepID=A0A3S4CCV2_9PEZI|nr:b2d7493a-2635-4622-a26f-d68b6d805ed6 [Thermothielavioides terrestris]
MAPWPERGAPSRLASPVPPPMPPPPLLPPPPPPQSQHLSTARHVRAGSAAERYRSTSRVSEVDVWDTMQNHQIQVDSSSSDEGLHPRSRPRPRHTRSVSHPFPSLFSSKKKRSSPRVAADDESTSESAGERPSLGAKPSSPMRGHRNGSSAGSRDFATGRCMTCGSLLRWPRDLLVFKCTICVTINDLQPVDRLDRPGNAPDAAGVAEERAASKDKAISLTYTKSQNGPSTVSSRSPHIDWAALEEWYSTAIEAARPWSDMYDSLIAEDPGLAVSPSVLQDIEAQILIGQEHVQRALLKACETILKRPGRRITEPQELRFLLLIAANPLLHASYKPYAGRFPHPHSALPTPNGVSPQSSGPASGRHSAIIKRIVGLLSNAPPECHNHLVAWFARYPESRFVQTKDLVAGFLAYRLIRQNEKKYEARIDYMAGLVPSMADGQSSASLHAALGHTQRSSKKQQQEKKPVVYQEDWQIKAAAQVLGFLFAANNMGHARRGLTNRPNATGNKNREFVRAPGQILATSDFYMTLLDESDLVADFETWERGQGRFSFCQHPFLLSIGAKIRILEHDARRQMEHKARDAFFDSIMTNRAVQQFLVLNIRRECLVEDSLKAVSEVIGSGGEEIKKGLKINFQGEEGVDAGGLRKEWFLLLVREVFNPDHGMFLYDEDSHYCYFNPNSLEPSEQFFLVGVVLGLAIYNSTILDIALPPFAFRKLLLAAPAPSTPSPQPRQQMTYTLDDLAEYRPRLAHGLRQLLAFEGDVESTFALDFAIDTERYGVVERVALCPGGENRPVTNANRREYVDAYVRHALDTSVARQFEPFKRGFFTVCGGGALSLFRPEEIDLLVRGSSGYADQPLDVDALRAGAQYDGWDCNSNHSNNNNNSSSSNGGSNSSSSSASGGGGGSSNANQSRADRAAPRDPAEDEPTVRWFWDALARAPPPAQRRLLAFVTGSDRVPAMGAASLRVRLVCLGDDCGRFPTARTCFNSLGLWRCKDRERFEAMLWRAVEESEGFGLK